MSRFTLSTIFLTALLAVSAMAATKSLHRPELRPGSWTARLFLAVLEAGMVVFAAMAVKSSPWSSLSLIELVVFPAVYGVELVYLAAIRKLPTGEALKGALMTSLTSACALAAVATAGFWVILIEGFSHWHS